MPEYHPLPRVREAGEVRLITGRVRAMKTSSVPTRCREMLSMDISEIAGTWKKPNIKQLSIHALSKDYFGD